MHLRLGSGDGWEPVGSAVRAASWLGLITAWAIGASGPAAATSPLPIRVMIVTTFAQEAEAWEQARAFGKKIPVPGLPMESPDVACGADLVCLVTVGEGHANAASSVAAVVFGRRFDLRRTWWVVTGIGGINPQHGTLGSAAWAEWLVEWGLQWELDARVKPPSWPSGYTGLLTRGPWQKSGTWYGTELFRLDGRLVRRAFELSRGVKLADSAAARKTRAAYPPPANRPPAVIRCDTVSGDTWWSGEHLAQRAEAWTRLLTDGRGRYCTTQQEDNAIYAALQRGDAAGLVDTRRVAVLRTGSNFDHPQPGSNSADNLLNFAEQGGFAPALDNLVLAATPLVNEIAGNWAGWRDGVPER
jgi:purine nucleoside permease